MHLRADLTNRVRTHDESKRPRRVRDPVLAFVDSVGRPGAGCPVEVCDIGRADRSREDIMPVETAILALFTLIRNHASVAHPIEELLEEPEPMLVINITRSILHYLDAKLG